MQRDRHAQEDHRGGDVRREVGELRLVEPGLAQDLDRTDQADQRDVLLQADTRLFIIGGTIRRSACGSTTVTIVWRLVMPSERAAARWLSWTPSMPARISSET